MFFGCGRGRFVWYRLVLLSEALILVQELASPTAGLRAGPAIDIAEDPYVEGHWLAVYACIPSPQGASTMLPPGAASPAFPAAAARSSR